MSTLISLAWNDSLKVGDAIIDEDHKGILALVSACDAADDEAFPALFLAFVEYMRAHFLREEDLMRQYGFPHHSIHKDEHDRVRLEMDELEARLGIDGLATARDYIRTVTPPWFVAHKNSMDSAIAGWIKMKGG